MGSSDAMVGAAMDPRAFPRLPMRAKTQATSKLNKQVSKDKAGRQDSVTVTWPLAGFRASSILGAALVLLSAASSRLTCRIRTPACSIIVAQPSTTYASGSCRCQSTAPALRPSGPGNRDGRRCTDTTPRLRGMTSESASTVGRCPYASASKGSKPASPPLLPASEATAASHCSLPSVGRTE